MDHKEKGRNNNVVAGIVLMIAGAVLLAYKLGMAIPFWIFSWKMLLITLGIVSGIKNGFRGAGWFILIVIGGIFLVDDLVPGSNFHDFILPIAIIGAGAFLLFRPKKFSGSCNSRKESQGQELLEEGPIRASIEEPTPATGLTGASERINELAKETGDYFKISSIFSGVNRNIFSKKFRGGKISSVFGGCEIDLTQADFDVSPVIKIEQVFSGMKLIIPLHWSVQNEIEGVFHSLEDQRKRYNERVYPDGKVLILKGSSVFAGIEITSR